MKNQINVGDQNTQQIGQNPISQPVQVSEKPKINYLATVGIVFACFIVFGFGGFYLGRQSSKPQNYVNDRQNQVSPPSPTSDPTANWKTYTNAKFNFSLKYPESWEEVLDTKNAPIATNILLSDSNFEVVFLDKTRELMCGPYACYPSVQIKTPIKDNNKIKLSLKDWATNYIKSKSPDTKLNPTSDLKELEVNGHQAVEFDNTVFIANGDFLYLIGFDASGSSGGNTSAKNNIDLIFDQILSTFKFTN